MSEPKPFRSVIAAMEREPTYGCPCCKYKTLRGRAGFEICPVCYWEDDGQDEHDADDVRGGPNGDLSLRRAQDNYRRFQACEARFVANVRAPLPEERVASNAVPGIIRPVNELTVAEVQAYPVWEYNLSHEDEQIRAQCQEQGVAFFFKQWGGTNKKAAGRVLAGRTWNEFPTTVSP